METLIQGWLSIWLYVMAGIAIVLGVLVYKNRKKWDARNTLCTLAVIVLVLHVLEEWVLPGGLHYSYNISHGSALLSRYPMNRLTDMLTNFGGVVLGCMVLKLWGFRKPAGIAVMLFSAMKIHPMNLQTGDITSVTRKNLKRIMVTSILSKKNMCDILAFGTEKM